MVVNGYLIITCFPEGLGYLSIPVILDRHFEDAVVLGWPCAAWECAFLLAPNCEEEDGTVVATIFTLGALAFFHETQGEGGPTRWASTSYKWGYEAPISRGLPCRCLLIHVVLH